MQTIIFSIVSGLGFGGAIFLRKLSVKQIGVPAVIFEAIANVILAVVVIIFLFPTNLNQLISKPQGIMFGLLGGISLGIGVTSFFIAARYGSVIFPAVIGPTVGTILSTFLAVIILRDSLSLVKVIGIIITITGLIVFTTVK